MDLPARSRPVAVPLLCGLLALTLGCASTPPDGARVFHFVVDGVAYEILSADADAVERANYLLRRDGATVGLRARDDDQDGTLDAVVVGDLSLEAANRIYRAGIAAAQSHGKLSVREPARLFSVDEPDGQLSVWTVMTGPDRWYNRFAFRGIDQAALLSSDQDADGVLDAVDDERVLPTAIQPRYERALQAGLDAGRIEVVGGRYRVTPDVEPRASAR